MPNCNCDEIVIETESPENNIEVEVPEQDKKTRFYNLDSQDWIGQLTPDGDLITPNTPIRPIFRDVKHLVDERLKEKFKSDSRVLSVSFPDLETITGQGALNSFCSNCANITSISFPKLERVVADNAMDNAFAYTNIEEISFPNLKIVSGASAFEDAFYDCTKVKKISFPELEVIEKSSSFYVAFYGCTNVTEISFPKLKRIGNGDDQDLGGCCIQAFSGMDSIERIVFPELEDVGYYGCYMGFMWNNNLKSLEFPKLKRVAYFGFRGCWGNPLLENISLPELEEVADGGLAYAFTDNVSLTEMSFPSLKKIGFAGFGETFSRDTSLRTVSFPSLEPSNFTDEDTETTGNYFYGMLSGCNGVTVHFPADLEPLLINRSYVIDGFGGTNTTILYDINPCYVQLNVIGSNNYRIYVFGVERVSPFMTGITDKEYNIFCNDNNSVFFGELTGLIVGETNTFTADVSVATTPIILRTPADVTFDVKYQGNSIPLETVSSGVYRFYTNGNGQTFNYTMGESATTRETSGTFTLTGSAMDTTLTPDPKQWVTFVRPNLSADGTIGGDAFAVWSSGTYSTAASRQAWRAVDGNTSSSYYWYSKNESNPIYEFYNPYPIKVASLTFYWTTASYCAKSFVLDVSNDGSTWTSLGTFNLTVAATATANINSANAYKYYRMTFTKQGTYLRLKELEMSATKYE